MTAYSFQPRFVDPILSGRKRQTIRAVGKRRHAKPGGPVELYTGMRTKACRLVGRATCTEVLAIELHPGTKPYVLLQDAASRGSIAPISGRDALDKFARSDGFEDWEAMSLFWLKNHGMAARRWSGLLITWRDLEPAL